MDIDKKTYKINDPVLCEKMVVVRYWDCMSGSSRCVTQHKSKSAALKCPGRLVPLQILRPTGQLKLRNQEIFEDVIKRNMTLRDAAKKHDLSPGTIRHIISRKILWEHPSVAAFGKNGSLGKIRNHFKCAEDKQRWRHI